MAENPKKSKRQSLIHQQKLCFWRNTKAANFMKQFRFLFLGLVLAASVVAIGHATVQRHVMLQTWYLIDGGDPDDPDDYRASTQGFSCDGQLTVCSIQAENDNGKPDLAFGSVTGHLSSYSATKHN